MLEVLVRGHIGEAEAAALSRGIALCGVSTFLPRWNQTLLRIPTWCWNRVAAWYCEPNEPPYPEGTCLYYSDKEAVEV